MLLQKVFAMLSLAATAAVAGEPMLFFNAAGRDRLRAEIQKGPDRQAWQEILQRARDYCNPKSRRYADPNRVDAPVPGVRIQVLAHTFGRHLTEWMHCIGFAYQMTGDKALAEHGILLLRTAAQRLPADDPRIAKSFAGARGDMMRGFAIGLDWLQPAIPPDVQKAVGAVGADYIRNLLKEEKRPHNWWTPYHNFMGVSLGAAGCLALRIRDQFPDEADGWIKQCAAGIRLWLAKGFDDQGAYFEGTGYAQYGLSNAVLFADALKRLGGPDLFAAPHLRHVPAFFAYSLLPGERVFDARNDANYAGLSDPFMLRLSTAYNDPVAKWLWERTATGVNPLTIVWHNDVQPRSPAQAGMPLQEYFRGRGLVVSRTGWKKSDIMFSVECGPFHAITHNQADKGSFTLYGLGYRWAIDSGYGNNRLPEGRCATVAHNCVLVDGHGQALSGAGLGTSGSIRTYRHNPRFDYTLCDATEAYNTNNRGQPGAVVQHALRHTLFIRPSHGAPAYAVVLDDIVKDNAEHTFTWLLHSDAQNLVEPLADGALIRPGAAYGNAFVETPLKAKGRGTCKLSFSVQKSAVYAVWARVRATGPELGKADSFFVQMDSGERIPWHMPTSAEWTWGKVSATPEHHLVQFDLQPGRHVLTFMTRESGAQVDQILVSRDLDAAFAPLDDAAAVRLEAEAGTVTAPMRVVKVRNAGKLPRMRVFIHAAGKLTTTVGHYETHPLFKAQTKAVQPEFAALLLPLPAAVETPAVTWRQTPESLSATIRWKHREDRLTWPRTGDRTPTVDLRPLGP